MNPLIPDNRTSNAARGKPVRLTGNDAFTQTVGLHRLHELILQSAQHFLIQEQHRAIEQIAGGGGGDSGGGVVFGGGA